MLITSFSGICSTKDLSSTFVIKARRSVLLSNAYKPHVQKFRTLTSRLAYFLQLSYQVLPEVLIVQLIMVSRYQGAILNVACLVASCLLLISALFLPLQPFVRPCEPVSEISEISETNFNLSPDVLPRLLQHRPLSSPQVRQEWGDFAVFQNMSHEYDHEWKNLTGESNGFILQYDVPSGVERLWGISMFHQLHCLQLLRGKLQRMLFPDNPLTEEYAVHGDIASDHYLHCFDYLRQSILCLADDTLEPVNKTVNGERIADYTLPRDCRSHKSLYAQTSSH
ncbi:hypothetical protein M3J07_002490 [Ascochyta lentis]